MSLNQLLGIELPIIQAPMAGVQGSAMAVAVSNAGGLGSLPCAMLGLDALRQELSAIQAQTRQPYNVNFFCHAPPQPDAEREAAWRATLGPYYAQHGIDVAVDMQGYTRQGRIEIFAARAAPVQVAFLSYVGTTALPAMDYLIADARALTPAARGQVTECVAWMPDSFMPYDGRRIIGTVGQLQFEVIQHRLESEYNAKCRYEPVNLYKACWVHSSDPKAMDEFLERRKRDIAADSEGALVFLAETSWVLQTAQENFPKIEFRFTSE